MRCTFLVSGAVVAAAVALAAGCSESPSAPVAPAPVPAATRYECRGDVAARTVACSVPAPSGARGDVLLGNQGIHTRLTSSNVAVVADTFAFDETVTNLLQIPIGTTDGTTPAPDGVQVFFTGPISTTGGSGTVEVANGDGVGTFTASNQPYFAYHEIVAPNATSAAKRWKLRFDPGVHQFSFYLLVSAPHPPGSGSVAFTVEAPRADSAQDDSMLVLVDFGSTPSPAIASVVASAAGRTAVLHPTESLQTMSGVLDLSGIPAQTLELRVLATTVNGDTGVILKSFIKDALPRLAIAAPVRSAVARPNLRIDVECTEDDPTACASVTVEVSRLNELPDSHGTQLASGATSVRANVSLASFDGEYVYIKVWGTDSRGRTRLHLVAVYVEASPALVAIDSGGTWAMDVDSTRLLYQDVDGSVKIHDRGTGASTLLFAARGGFGYLHPQGAIWQGEIDGSSHLYDWRAGALNDLGRGLYRLVVAGTWAVFPVFGSGTVYRRDLTSGAMVTVTTEGGSGGDSPAEVAPNGDVVYDTYDYGVPQASNRFDIFHYRDGTTTRLTNDPDDVHQNLLPLTDGTNVLFLRETLPASGSGGYTIMLWRDGNLTPLTQRTPNPGGWGPEIYQAAGGWIAYVTSDGVRTRSPLGDDRLVPSTANCHIRGLSADGTLVYATDLYTSESPIYVLRAPYTGTPIRVGRDQGSRVRFHGSELIYLLGNTAFHVNY